MNKEKNYIKVKYNTTLRDSSIEIYYDERNNSYSRDTYGRHIWYYISSPPYQEIIKRCPDNIVFIICDNDWKEIMKDGNSEEFEVSFSSLMQLYKFHFEKLLTTIPNLKKEGFSEWILGFTKKEIDRTSELNWVRTMNKVLHIEPVITFFFLGEEYAIFKIKKKHKCCEAYWYEYVAGRLNREEHEDYFTHFGYEY